MVENSSSIPPSSATRTSSSGTSVLDYSTTQVNSSKSSGTLNLPVQQAPHNWSEGKAPQVLEGKVIYSNPQAGEMRVRVGESEIILKTALNLAHDTKILIKINFVDNQMLANITVLDNVEQQPLPKLPLPAQLPELDSQLNIINIQQGVKLRAAVVPNNKTASIDTLLQIMDSVDIPKLKNLARTANHTLLESFIYSPKPNEFLNRLPKSQIDLLTQTIKSIFKLETHEADAPLFTPDAKRAYALPQGTIKQPEKQGDNNKHNQSGQSNSGNSNQQMMPNGNNDADSLPDDLLMILTASTAINNLVKETGERLTTSMPQSQLLSTEEMLATEKVTNNFSQNQSSIKNYVIDVLDIMTVENDLKQIKTRIRMLNEKIETYHMPEYAALPIKIARVESITKEGFPLLRAETFDPENEFAAPEVEHFILKQQANVSTDSIILIKAVPAAPEGITKAALAEPFSFQFENFEPFSNREWPALQEAIALLISSGTTSAATQNINNIVPSAAHNMPTTALFFLAALRHGSLGGWLGENIIQNLKSMGSDDLLKELSSNFTRISSSSKEALPGDWRVISMPLFFEAKLEQIQIYFRNEYEDESNKNESGKSVRFIFNLQLSNLGRMQLDGKICKPRKKLDMIIRSDIKMSDEIRQNITANFARGLEQSGMEGQISFQSGQSAIVKIEEPQSSGTMIV